jgi:hypothetical protein
MRGSKPSVESLCVGEVECGLVVYLCGLYV